MASVIPLIKKIVRRANERHSDGRFAKFFLFKIGGKSFSIAVSDVAEVAQVPQVMSVPEKSDIISGVVNIRGKVIPVINIRKKMSLSAISKTSDDYRLLLLWISKDEYVGIIIDSIEYRLKDGIIENNTAELEKLDENPVRYATINGEKWPVLSINNWVSEAEFQDINRVIETF